MGSAMGTLSLYNAYTGMDGRQKARFGADVLTPTPYFDPGEKARITMDATNWANNILRRL